MVDMVSLYVNEIRIFSLSEIFSLDLHYTRLKYNSLKKVLSWQILESNMRNRQASISEIDMPDSQMIMMIWEHMRRMQGGRVSAHYVLRII